MNIGSALVGGFFGGPLGAIGGAIGGGRGALLGSLFSNMSGIGGVSPFVTLMGNGCMNYSMSCMPSWGGYSPYGLGGFGMGGHPMMGRGWW